MSTVPSDDWLSTTMTRSLVSSAATRRSSINGAISVALLCVTITTATSACALAPTNLARAIFACDDLTNSACL